MSDDEEMLEIGRIVTEYQEAKRRLVALQSQASSLGSVIESMGQGLRFAKLPVERFTPQLLAMLDAERITTLVQEIDVTWIQVEASRKKLTSLGLEPKDN